MSQLVLDAIRDRILSGVLSANCWIKQDVLAAELGVSKIPIREALRKLELEGLVKSETNRGFFVRPILAEEAEDIFALRLKVEPEIVLLAAQAAGGVEQSVAIQAHRKLHKAVLAQSPDVTALNRAFHLSLVLPSGRLITADFVERLHVMAERYVRLHLAPIERADRANREHQALLDAWLARDPQVVQMTDLHISQTLADLRMQLRS
jgi:DNA-binding GntR family transcriptional regulator